MEEVRGPNSNLDKNGLEAQQKIKNRQSSPDKMECLHIPKCNKTTIYARSDFPFFFLQFSVD